MILLTILNHFTLKSIVFSHLVIVKKFLNDSFILGQK